MLHQLLENVDAFDTRAAFSLRRDAVEAGCATRSLCPLLSDLRSARGSRHGLSAAATKVVSINALLAYLLNLKGC